ncbi:MAG: response regulator [Bacteroidota bacterium]|nr:response regulator [Bacteroidota bacterium]
MRQLENSYYENYFLDNQFLYKSTILLVDDDPKFLSRLEEVISLEDFNIIKASSTEDALSKANGRKIDLVITEFMFKTKSSVELFSLIRKSNPVVPIIVITGYPELISATDVRMFGGNHLLTKPLDIAKLFNILRNYCN